ncbi:protocatechuate 3,4-dioxygenase subunit alpha [Rhodoglobus aureus]|uniref:Protocatechuate 3,4-dioxygenase subunit alpha n=1 Tax=Rhodoglobus aureus TaxID=191497 RepID=A0ABN1VLV5_9MICO
MSLLPTPGQTVGPFFGYALPYEGSENLVPPHHPHAVRLTGAVYDGTGVPVPDALIEVWQADENGNIPTARGSLTRDRHVFTGFGRSATTRDGSYSFTTVEPGSINDTAPFFALVLFARGILDKLHSRIYLPQDRDALEHDPFLSVLPPQRRATLVANRQSDGSLHHDIHLQGDDETVFIDFS